MGKPNYVKRGCSRRKSRDRVPTELKHLSKSRNRKKDLPRTFGTDSTDAKGLFLFSLCLSVLEVRGGNIP